MAELLALLILTDNFQAAVAAGTAGARRSTPADTGHAAGVADLIVRLGATRNDRNERKAQSKGRKGPADSHDLVSIQWAIRGG